MIKRILIAAALIAPIAAHAENASLLCQTTDTKEMIDIVDIGDHRVLVQVQGGTFYEGAAKFEDPILYVVVTFSNGAIALKYNVATKTGKLGAEINDERQVHDVLCQFRS